MPESPESTPDPDWSQIDAAFQAALERPVGERVAWVRETYAGQAALRDAVLDLLDDEAASAELFDAAIRARDAVAAAAVAEEAGGVDLVGSRIGAYRLESLLATGGMGAVYRAQRDDGEFRQTVALKILPGWATDAQTVARLRAERQILSSLQHPHITRLLDGGRTGDGYPYLVTEFIDGTSITDFAANNDLDLEARLALFLDVADAVAYAHRQGVIHRDIKPANILVDRDGRPHLLDFGIAKLREAGVAPVTAPRTATGFTPMTPEYASPEQLAGGDVGIASDVFQLGLLLYRLLTGERLPAEHRSASGRTRPSTAVLRQAPDRRRLDGLDPTTVARRLRGDLDTIVLKALRERPEDRYATAQAFGDDLRRYLAGKAIEARPESPWSAARRLARQYPVAAGLAMALLVVLLVWAGSLSFYARELERQRDEAARQATRAEQVRDVLVDIFRRSDPLQGDTIGGKSASVWDSLDAAAEEARETLADDPEVLAELLGTLSVLQGYAGEEAASIALLEESVALLRTLGPDQEPALAQQLSELTKHVAMNDRERAARLRGEVEGMLPRLVREAPSGAVNVLADLAVLDYETGNYDLALAENEQIIALLDLHGLERWSLRIEALFGSGNNLVALERYDEAEERLAEALALTEAHFGPDHARVTGTLSALTNLERRRGNDDRAIAWGERLVSVMERNNEPGYEGLLAARNNLAIAYGSAGRSAEEQAMLRALIQQRRSMTGEEGDRALAVNLKNYASSLHATGDLAAAREAVLEARAMMQRHYPEDSPIQATSWFTLALIELDSGDAPAAVTALEQTRAILEPALGEAHYQVQVTRCTLAEALRVQGNVDEAERLARPALAALENTRGGRETYRQRCRATVAALDGDALTGARPGREDASSP